MFARQTGGCVVNNTQPMASNHEMNSQSSKLGAARDTSRIKSTVEPQSLNLIQTEPLTLALEIPATAHANQARRVFEKLPLEAKIQYLTHNKYRPQSGLSLPGLATLQTHLRNKISDNAMSKIEGLVALYGALASTSDASGFCCVLTLYAKTHGQESLTGKLTDIARNLFDSYSPQSTHVKPQWLVKMKEGLHNWRLIINSPSFAKISRVLSLLVTLGCVGNTSIHLGNFEIFAVKAQEKHVNAVDLMDALIDTVVYFAEGAYMCYQTGSLKPLLFSTSEVVEVQETYIRIMSQWEYARNGNLSKFTDTTEAQFDKDLGDTVTRLCDLYKTMPNGVEKKIIQQKWEALARVQAEWTAVRVAGGLRAAPFSGKLYGDSGVGKSTLADIIMSTILKASDVPCTSEFVATLNEADAYDSNYRSFITGIKIDDYGNAKSQFWDKAPSDQIIRIVNNIRETAVMADVANKGKITIEPKALVVTTNVEQMHAGVTSNNPMSVLRRLHHHLEVKVRPEFKTDNMLDSNKVIDKFGTLDKINDIWLITMKQPIAKSSSGSDSQLFGSWKILHTDLSVFEYLNILIADVKRHVHNQKQITDSFQEPSDLVTICPQCNKLTETCSCGYKPQFGERIATILAKKAKDIKLESQILQLNTETKVEDIAVKALLKASKKLAESPYIEWTTWVPEKWIGNEWVRWGILTAGEDYINQSLAEYSRRFLIMTTLFTLMATWLSLNCGILTFIFMITYFMLCYSGVVRAKQNAYMKEILTRRDAVSEAFKSARDEHVQYACGVFAGLSVIYGVCQVIKALRSSLSLQGSLAPETSEEIAERDREENVWEQPKQRKLNPYGFSTAQEAEKITTSIARMECNKKFTGCFMLSTNVVAVPHHFLPPKTMQAKVMYRGNVYSFELNPKFCSRVGRADMVLCCVLNTGDLKDRINQFSDEPITGTQMCTMHGLMPDRSPFKTNLLWNRADTAFDNGHCVINGAHYTLNMDTFDGMCMSPILVENQRREIIGIHIGGVTGTGKGCGMEILRSDLIIARNRLQALNSMTSFGPQAAPLPSTIAGRPVITSTKIHRKCPTNFLEGETNITIYGSTTSASFHKSRVIPTPISDTVYKVTGFENLWGPPKFSQPKVLENGAVDPQKWKPWYESIKYSANPSGGFDPADLKRAVEDYKSQLFRVLNKQKKVWKVDIRPLTEIETVSGIDGKRFIDAMKTSTSMGFPISGPKSNHLIDLPPTEEHACPRTFTKEIWDMVRDVLAACDNNQQLPVVFLASLKDEPTLCTKDKVRVFQAAPIVLQILIRMYFLPCGRFLSMNPLISECAVGVNSHGPEWHDLAQHMRHFGEDRIIAGDFSKYDLSMPEQLTLAANQILIDIAEWSGNYTPVELNRMRVIAHAVCSPLVNFDGTLLRLHGSNPSGQNMTVYVNSIVNSLLHRLAFFDEYSEEDMIAIGEALELGRPATVWDLMRLMTYGDDGKGSVRRGYDKFNHIQMRNYLAKHNIGYTMPDKESAPVAFMNDHEADFLKRKNEYSQDLGLIVGKLEEKSLFKSLHSILESKVESPLSVSAQNIGSALREWFFHGKEVYEHRREQMKQIAAEHDLPVPDLEVTYEERVENFKNKYTYKPQSGTIQSDEEEKLSEITKDHPMFLCYEDVSNAVVRQVNIFAHMDLNELRATNVEQLVTLRDGSLTKGVRRKARINHLATKILCQWKNTNPLEIWTFEDEMSVITPPQACSEEDILVDRVKEVLGNPTFEEYDVLGGLGGKGDLVYISNGVILVIECKRIVGRPYKFAKYVEYQAMKYGKIFADISPPSVTVYCITYTEYGFTIVDMHGEPKFPRKFAQLLDTIPLRR